MSKYANQLHVVLCQIVNAVNAQQLNQLLELIILIYNHVLIIAQDKDQEGALRAHKVCHNQPLPRTSNIQDEWCTTATSSCGECGAPSVVQNINLEKKPGGSPGF
jgi:hypothetical protein